MTAQQELRPLELPAALTPAWCAQAAAALDAASRAGPAALKAVLPQDVVCALLERCQQLLQAEPTLLEVRPKAGGQAAAAARPAASPLLAGSLWVLQGCAAAVIRCTVWPCYLPASPPHRRRPYFGMCRLCVRRWRPPRARRWWLWATHTASSTMCAACEEQ